MPLAPRASRISSITMRYSRASSCACSLTSSGSGCSVTEMRSAPPMPSPWPWPSSARCRARMVAPRWPPGSMAGCPSSSATTPIGENWPLRRVAITTRGGPSLASASSKAARASSLVIAIAIAMFGRMTPSSRGRRGRIVVLMSVLMAKMQTRRGAVAFPLDTNMRSPYHRTHVRFALSPPSGRRARGSRLHSSRSPCWRCRGRPRAHVPPASTSCCPVRRCGASPARPTAATPIPTSRRSRAPVICTAR